MKLLFSILLVLMICGCNTRDIYYEGEKYRAVGMVKSDYVGDFIETGKKGDFIETGKKDVPLYIIVYIKEK